MFFINAHECELLALIVVGVLAFYLLAYKRQYHQGCRRAILVIALMVLCYGHWAISRYERGYREHLLSNLRSVARLYRDGVVFLGHEHIPFGEDSADNEIYQRICRFFRAGHISFPMIPSVYTMRKDEKGELVMFVYPGLREKDGQYSYLVPFGGSMSVLGEMGGADRIFATGESSITSVYTDEYGTWVTALEPIPAADGTIEAILGVDYIADEWHAEINRFGRYPLLYALALFIIGFGGVVFWAESWLRKRKDQLLVEQSEERLRLMLDAIPLACNLWDANQSLIDCSLETVKMFGFKDRQECLTHYKDRWPESRSDRRSVRDVANDYFEKALLDGFSRAEMDYLDRDGKLFPVEVTFIRTLHRNIPVIATYIKDLRQERQLDELREADERMQAMLDAIPMGCALWESDFRFIDCNMEAVRMFDMESKEHLGQMFVTLSPEYQPNGQRSRETAAQMIMDAYKTGYHRREWMHQKLDGTLIPSDVTLVRVRHGNDYAVAGFTFDLRELKKKEEELRHYAESLEKARTDAEKARDEAEIANRVKSEFLANMSHEMRTPLNGVIGLSDLLLGMNPDATQYEFIEQVKSSGLSLLAIISNILDYTKMESEIPKLHLEPFDPRVLTHSVRDTFISQATAKKLNFDVSFSGHLPSVVHGDENRVHQVLTQLVNNAIKFTNHGSVRIDVTAKSVSHTDATILFRIIDTGIGIPQTCLDKLFMVFYRVDSSLTRSFGGVGIGLAMAMKLVNLMGGKIGVESEEGKGTTFWFELPFATGNP